VQLRTASQRRRCGAPVPQHVEERCTTPPSLPCSPQHVEEEP